jgi:excinuclease ABC subunit B
MTMWSIFVIFQFVSPYQPAGDQPQAIAQLVQGLQEGKQHGVLEGATGTGKTYTMARVIQRAQRPTVVLAHNKTLADQLYREFKAFFPRNAVVYYVSDYVLYQPQSYQPSYDTYYDKRAVLDPQLTRQRLAAVTAAISRPDVIVVATVSCLFDIGSPQAFRELAVPLAVGATADRDEVLARLAHIRYSHAGGLLRPGAFRVRGDRIDVTPPYEDVVYRIELRNGRVDRLLSLNREDSDPVQQHDHILIYPACLHVLPKGWVEAGVADIKQELAARLLQLRGEGRLLEAQRLEAATWSDIEQLLKHGYCPGIENYSRALNRRLPGSPPDTLLDYLPADCLTFVDESHVTVPQIRAMHTGSQSRMQNLVENGFRLPSAMDFRPLTFAEWERRASQVVFVSATPAPYELGKAGGNVVKQVIRPTGLLDPIIEVRPSDKQMTSLFREIRQRVAVGERTLVMTITKRQAEEVADDLSKQGVGCRWLHSGLNARKRVAVLDELRRGEFDVLVGVNLLREGIDLPEVSLVAVMDADKAGFLRSTSSLVQVIGRAARNVNAKAIFFANTVTPAMKQAIVETQGRRRIQKEFNRKHGKTPMPISRKDRDVVPIVSRHPMRATAALPVAVC